MEKTLHLYLNSEVSELSINPIVEAITKANDENAIFMSDILDPMETRFTDKIEKIVLHINSSGGYVDSGIELVSVIRTSKIPVECIVTNAHSMAFVIMIACDKRKMYPTSFCMWHNISSGVQGDHETMKEVTKQMEVTKEIIHELLYAKTKLDKKFLMKIYKGKKDRYFGVKEALEFGLIDEVIEYIK